MKVSTPLFVRLRLGVALSPTPIPSVFFMFPKFLEVTDSLSPSGLNYFPPPPQYDPA